MSTGQKTQAAFIQGSQSTADQESSHSALFYLFQEVSRLASPVHNSFLDTNSPSKWLNETSKRDNFIVRNEEDNAHLFQSFNNSCQHSLSNKLPYNQVNKVKEESHSSNITTLAESHYECNSPWKVLSLINLQCERLLHRRDVEESDPGSGSSTAKLGHLTAKSTTAAADVKEQGVRSDSVNVEYTLRPSLLICKRQEITASVSHVEDIRGVCSVGASYYKPQSCVKESKVGCSVQPQSTEKTETVIPALLEESTTASSQPQHGDKREVKFSVSRLLEWNQECKKDCFLTEQDFLNIPLSENALAQAHIPNASLNSQLTFNSNEDTSVALSKSALTLDHNANIALSTEPPCDTQLPPLSAILPSSQSASLFFSATEGCFSLPKKDKIPGSKAECIHASIEEKSPAAEQLKSSSYNVLATTLKPELRPVQREELSLASSQQWRTKTPRKQPHPSRSVDIQDPDFQGVTFSMGTELDDSREQCRLLITSKYRYWQMYYIFDKVCASCCTRKTPMWRDAEDGTPLCNACGIRYKKYRVRCVNCWHIPRKEGNSNSCCLKCGNLVSGWPHTD
uniref:GATA-type domain-containing protein n=1 Tax=Seriola dumerili TaxID=41447 RepID=A0A3B4VN49_SERDU